MPCSANASPASPPSRLPERGVAELRPPSTTIVAPADLLDEPSLVNRWFQKWITRLGLESRPRLRRFLIGIIGGTVILLGLVMIVLPGPAFIVVPLGFAILASEFAWARRVWRRGKILVARVRGNRTNPTARQPEHIA